jgi:hypothetical protein
MPGPEEHTYLFDNTCSMKTEIFRYIYGKWAKATSNPEGTLNQLQVQTITHNKSPTATEHEFLIVETIDKSDQESKPKIFLLDRIVSGETVRADDPRLSNIPTTKEKLKRLGSSAVSMLPGVRPTSELRSMEEGSSFSSSSTSLSSLDKSTALLTKSADVVASLKSEFVLAEDRVRGESYVRSLNCHGQVVQYFKPNNCSLFELVCMAQAVHDLHPTYTVEADQCYFYAGLIYEATKQHFGQVPTENADESKSTLYGIDGHLSGKQGRIVGVKVCLIEQNEVNAVIGKFKKDYREQIAKVFYSFTAIQINSNDILCRSRHQHVLMKVSLTRTAVMRYSKANFSVQRTYPSTAQAPPP